MKERRKEEAKKKQTKALDRWALTNRSLNLNLDLDLREKKTKNQTQQGKYVVLFFYPLDFTFVCPTGKRR